MDDAAGRKDFFIKMDPARSQQQMTLIHRRPREKISPFPFPRKTLHAESCKWNTSLGLAADEMRWACASDWATDRQTGESCLHFRILSAQLGLSYVEIISLRDKSFIQSHAWWNPSLAFALYNNLTRNEWFIDPLWSDGRSNGRTDNLNFSHDDI